MLYVIAETLTSTRTKKVKTKGKRLGTRYGKAERNRSRERDEEGKRKPVLCRVESELLLSPLYIFLIRQAAEMKRVLLIGRMFQLRCLDFVKYCRQVLS